MNLIKQIIKKGTSYYRLTLLINEKGIPTTKYRITKLAKLKKIKKLNLDFFVALKKVSGKSWEEIGEILEKIY